MQKCRRVSDRRREKETCLASFVHVCVPGVVCKVIARYMRTMMWERERERLGKGLMPVMPLLFTAGYINWSRIQCAVQVIQLQSGSGWSVSTLIATQYSDTLPSYILSVGDHAVYPLDRQSQQHRWSGSIRRFCVCLCVDCCRWLISSGRSVAIKSPCDYHQVNGKRLLSTQVDSCYSLVRVVTWSTSLAVIIWIMSAFGRHLPAGKWQVALAPT